MAVPSANAATQTVDVDALWDYGNPHLSEERFRNAMHGATRDDRLVLLTQVARAQGLRGDRAAACDTLAEVAGQMSDASALAQVRYHLELGRTSASAAHTSSELTSEGVEAAKRSFMMAYELAAAAGLDYFGVDALHMMAIVEPGVEAQISWNERAVAYMEQSKQPEARRWEGSLRNNLGYARHLNGQYDEAIVQFKLSREANERAGMERNVRIADWMIARTLRMQKKLDEALAIQLRLEQEWAAAGAQSPYVFAELEILYRELGDEARAHQYGSKARPAAG